MNPDNGPWRDDDEAKALVTAMREQTPDGKTSDERGGVPPTNKTIPAKPVDTGGVEGLAEEIDCRVEELFTNDATVEVFVDGGRVVIGTRESGDRFRELGSGSTFLHALGKSTTPITRNIAANHATEKPTDSMGGETDKDYASPDGSDASEAVSENAGARVADTEAAIQAMRDLSGPLGRARLELGDHESSGAMLEAFSRLRYALTGFSQDAPIRGWCECQGVDGTLHKHYHKPPYGCARCSKCKAFQADNNTLDLAMREQTAQAIDHDAGEGNPTDKPNPDAPQPEKREGPWKPNDKLPSHDGVALWTLDAREAAIANAARAEQPEGDERLGSLLHEAIDLLGRWDAVPMGAAPPHELTHNSAKFALRAAVALSALGSGEGQ